MTSCYNNSTKNNRLSPYLTTAPAYPILPNYHLNSFYGGSQHVQNQCTNPLSLSFSHGCSVPLNGVFIQKCSFLSSPLYDKDYPFNTNRNSPILTYSPSKSPDVTSNLSLCSNVVPFYQISSNVPKHGHYNISKNLSKKPLHITQSYDINSNAVLFQNNSNCFQPTDRHANQMQFSIKKFTSPKISEKNLVLPYKNNASIADHPAKNILNTTKNLENHRKDNLEILKYTNKNTKKFSSLLERNDTAVNSNFKAYTALNGNFTKSLEEHDIGITKEFEKKVTGRDNYKTNNSHNHVDMKSLDSSNNALDLGNMKNENNYQDEEQLSEQRIKKSPISCKHYCFENRTWFHHNNWSSPVYYKSPISYSNSITHSSPQIKSKLQDGQKKIQTSLQQSNKLEIDINASLRNNKKICKPIHYDNLQKIELECQSPMISSLQFERKSCNGSIIKKSTKHINLNHNFNGSLSCNNKGLSNANVTMTTKGTKKQVDKKKMYLDLKAVKKSNEDISISSGKTKLLSINSKKNHRENETLLEENQFSRTSRSETSYSKLNPNDFSSKKFTFLTKEPFKYTIPVIESKSQAILSNYEESPKFALLTETQNNIFKIQTEVEREETKEYCNELQLSKEANCKKNNSLLKNVENKANNSLKNSATLPPNKKYKTDCIDPLLNLKSQMKKTQMNEEIFQENQKHSSKPIKSNVIANEIKRKNQNKDLSYSQSYLDDEIFSTSLKTNRSSNTQYSHVKSRVTEYCRKKSSNDYDKLSNDSSCSQSTYCATPCVSKYKSVTRNLDHISSGKNSISSNSSRLSCSQCTNNLVLSTKKSEKNVFTSEKKKHKKKTLNNNDIIDKDKSGSSSEEKSNTITQNFNDLSDAQEIKILNKKNVVNTSFNNSSLFAFRGIPCHTALRSQRKQKFYDKLHLNSNKNLDKKIEVSQSLLNKQNSKTILQSFSLRYKKLGSENENKNMCDSFFQEPYASKTCNSNALPRYFSMDNNSNLDKIANIKCLKNRNLSTISNFSDKTNNTNFSHKNTNFSSQTLKEDKQISGIKNNKIKETYNKSQTSSFRRLTAEKVSIDQKFPCDKTFLRNNTNNAKCMAYKNSEALSIQSRTLQNCKTTNKDQSRCFTKENTTHNKKYSKSLPPQKARPRSIIKSGSTKRSVEIQTEVLDSLASDELKNTATSTEFFDSYFNKEILFHDTNLLKNCSNKHDVEIQATEESNDSTNEMINKDNNEHETLSLTSLDMIDMINTELLSKFEAPKHRKDNEKNQKLYNLDPVHVINEYTKLDDNERLLEEKYLCNKDLKNKTINKFQAGETFDNNKVSLSYIESQERPQEICKECEKKEEAENVKNTTIHTSFPKDNNTKDIRNIYLQNSSTSQKNDNEIFFTQKKETCLDESLKLTDNNSFAKSLKKNKFSSLDSTLNLITLENSSSFGFSDEASTTLSMSDIDNIYTSESAMKQVENYSSYNNFKILSDESKNERHQSNCSIPKFEIKKKNVLFFESALENDMINNKKSSNFLSNSKFFNTSFNKILNYDYSRKTTSQDHLDSIEPNEKDRLHLAKDDSDIMNSFKKENKKNSCQMNNVLEINIKEKQTAEENELKKSKQSFLILKNNFNKGEIEKNITKPNYYDIAKEIVEYPLDRNIRFLDYLNEILSIKDPNERKLKLHLYMDRRDKKRNLKELKKNATERLIMAQDLDIYRNDFNSLKKFENINSMLAFGNINSVENVENKNSDMVDKNLCDTNAQMLEIHKYSNSTNSSLALGYEKNILQMELASSEAQKTQFSPIIKHFLTKYSKGKLYKKIKERALNTFFTSDTQRDNIEKIVDVAAVTESSTKNNLMEKQVNYEESTELREYSIKEINLQKNVEQPTEVEKFDLTTVIKFRNIKEVPKTSFNDNLSRQSASVEYIEQRSVVDQHQNDETLLHSFNNNDKFLSSTEDTVPYSFQDSIEFLCFKNSQLSSYLETIPEADSEVDSEKYLSSRCSIK